MESSTSEHGTTSRKRVHDATTGDLKDKTPKQHKIAKVAIVSKNDGR